MGPTPFDVAGAEKPLQKVDFAMKQTNICRLSGDIITHFSTHFNALYFHNERAEQLWFRVEF